MSFATYFLIFLNKTYDTFIKYLHFCLLLFNLGFGLSFEPNLEARSNIDHRSIAMKRSAEEAFGGENRR